MVAERDVVLERISIEPSNRCAKACWFCYSASSPSGETRWSESEIIRLVRDCARAGVRAVSFGGGEPLEFPGIFGVLEALEGAAFRSLTTNGLLLDGFMLHRLVAARPDKVHVSLHFPERPEEVERVADQVLALEDRGIRSGVNLLVRRSRLQDARAVTDRLRARGLGQDRIVFLPMRGQDTPSPAELARVAGTPRFQSMTCLLGCGRSPRFCAVGWDKTVAWCSYTTARRPLESLDHVGLTRALSDLDVVFCGGSDEGTERLPGRSLDGHDLVRRRPERSRGGLR